jgi:hypothetical protein
MDQFTNHSNEPGDGMPYGYNWFTDDEFTGNSSPLDFFHTPYEELDDNELDDVDSSNDYETVDVHDDYDPRLCMWCQENERQPDSQCCSSCEQALREEAEQYVEEYDQLESTYPLVTIEPRQCITEQEFVISNEKGVSAFDDALMRGQFQSEGMLNNSTTDELTISLVCTNLQRDSSSPSEMQFDNWCELCERWYEADSGCVGCDSCEIRALQEPMIDALLEQ